MSTRQMALDLAVDNQELSAIRAQIRRNSARRISAEELGSAISRYP